jgi:hypothetical protein
MAFKTFAPGVLTSSDVNTFLMRQSVIVCTAATRPASPNEGMTIYETDTDKYLGYTGTAWKEVTDLGDWITYTPVLGGGTSAIGNGTVAGAYKIVGPVVHFFARITWGSTTVFDATEITISVPVAGVFTDYVFGSGNAVDDSAGVAYGPVSLTNSTLTTVFAWSPDPAVAGGIGKVRAAKPFTWAVNDRLSISGTYRRTA